nr:trehalose-6-phosphate synthase [Chiayiivirga flava]
MSRPASASGRLFVVSNRVMQRGQTQAGGLAQAMLSLLESRGGTWVGWSGETARATALHAHDVDRIRYRTFDFDAAQFEGYYAGFANGCLWPLLHARIDLMRFRAGALKHYLQVNETFAAWLAAELRDDDTVWVHDYHLFPLAGMLRARGVRCRIGFFLHTPLPAARTLLHLPQHERTLGALAHYDLVGLQTPADASALRDYFATLPQVRRVDDDGAEFIDGHRCAVACFPIGIDVDALARLSEAAVDDADVRTVQDSLGDRHLLIGVDRLDYSKGLPQRLQAFGRLLARRPRMRRRATFLQIAPECRREVNEYRALSREVQRLVGDINGHHADASWTPVRYVNQGYPHAQLAGFYRIARVGVVTPLCDGMNLVAKEYLACQPAHDPGVLVLSRFAGAAVELADCALLVNPFDTDAVAAALARALDMPLAERRARWTTGMQRLRAGNIHQWRQDFLDALARTAG